MGSMLNELKMRRLLILLQPIEILYFSPQIGLLILLFFQLMATPFTIVESIRTENNLIAVLNNGLTCYKDIESAIKCIVDS